MSIAGSNICQGGSAYLLTPHRERITTSGWTSQQQQHQQTNERIAVTQNTETMTTWHSPTQGEPPAHNRRVHVQLCIYTLLQMHSSPSRVAAAESHRRVQPRTTNPATHVPFTRPLHARLHQIHRPVLLTRRPRKPVPSARPGSAARLSVILPPRGRRPAVPGAFLSEPTHGSYKPRSSRKLVQAHMLVTAVCALMHGRCRPDPRPPAALAVEPPLPRLYHLA